MTGSNSKKTTEKTHREQADLLCFVVGPIGVAGSETRKHSDMILHGVIRHVLQEGAFKYLVRRADDDVRPGMIGDRIIHDIINAELVIADLTDLNPNVFYEIGIRHASLKPTIHIAKVGTKLPFDNIGHDTIFIDVTDWNDIEKARARLSASVRSISDSTYRVSNPITQANASFTLRESADTKDQLLADVRDRLMLLEKQFKQSSIAYKRSARAYQLERSRKDTAPEWSGEDSVPEWARRDTLNEIMSIAVQTVKTDEQLTVDFVEAAVVLKLIPDAINFTKNMITYSVDGIEIEMGRTGKIWSTRELKS